MMVITERRKMGMEVVGRARKWLRKEKGMGWEVCI
jgi:hypothetical protein